MGEEVLDFLWGEDHEIGRNGEGGCHIQHCSFRSCIIREAVEITKCSHNFNCEWGYRLSETCLHLFFHNDLHS
jgi:hypothetical protein